MVGRHTERKRDDFRPKRGGFSEVTVFCVIAEVAGYHFGVVSNLDKSLILVLPGFLVSLLGEEQPHTFTLISHRGLMGENIKNDHVAGVRVKTLQSHNVMADQFLCPGLLPCLRKHFSDGLGFPRQTVILLNIIYQSYALLVREQPQL